jgi:ATP-binding cassette subfamily G (WHITE) protein 2 (SNQ2)
MFSFVDGVNLSFSTDATSFFFQLRIVVERNTTALWRSPDYAFTRLFVTTFISFFVSLSFLQLGNSVRDLQFRAFGMFVFRPAFSVFSLTGLSPLKILGCRPTRARDVSD